MSVDMQPQGGDADRFKDEYIGVIEVAADTNDMLRCKVRVHGVYPETMATEDLPPAEFRFPVGMRPLNGLFIPVQVGDYVWVDFPYMGDTRRPRITGGAHFAPGGVPNVPSAATGGTSFALTVNGVSIEIKADSSFTLKQVGSEAGLSISKTGAVTILSSTSITLDAPIITLDSPIITVTGNLSGDGTAVPGGLATATFTGDIADKNGTMQEMRDIYNGTHPSMV
jgi:hypothetical protein